MVNELLAAAGSAGIKVRQERLEYRDARASSGLVSIKGEAVLFLDKDIPEEEKLEHLARALKTADLTDVFLTPAARHLLEPDQE